MKDHAPTYGPDAWRALVRTRRGEAVEARRDAAASHRRMTEAEARAAVAEARAEAAERKLLEVLGSRSWRITAPLRRLLGAPPTAIPGAGGVAGGVTPAAEPAPAPPSPRTAYEEWLVRFDTLSPEDEDALRRAGDDPDLPSLFVAVPLGAAQAGEIAATLAGLRRSMLGRWRAVAVAGRATGEAAGRAAAEAAASDPRLRILPDADRPEARPAPDERLVLLRPGTVPREHALNLLAAAGRDPALRLAYADEDRVSLDGRRSDPFFKPGFSPELLRRIDLVGGLALLGGPAEALHATLRTAADGGFEDTLRAFALPLRGTAALRIPEILSGDLRAPRPPAATGHPPPGRCDGPFVSVIIPTRDGADLLRACLDGVFPALDGRGEVVVVDNGSTEEAALRLLAGLEATGAARVLRAPGPFNYARLNNLAVAASRGGVLVFLNNDTVVRDPAWLDRLLEAVAPEDVGAVGAKLLHPDLTVQHGGVVLGVGGTVAHLDVGLAVDDPGVRGLAVTTREVSAVTGALLAMRREVFEAVGGFDEGLAVAFNDVRLCLDALARGHRTIRLAAPLLIHHEAKTRGRDEGHARIAAFRGEARRAREGHRDLFLEDPYHNPNLDILGGGGLAVPPRRGRAWRRAAGHLRVVIAAATHEADRVPARLVAREAAALLARGHEVIVAGPRGTREPAYEGCRRVEVADAEALAVLAVEAGADWVVVSGDPFRGLPLRLGRACRTALLDEGDPPPALHPNADAHFAAVAALDLDRDLADLVLPAEGVALLGNGDLGPDGGEAALRAATRAGRGWREKIVVLTAIPLAAGESRRSGLGTLLALPERLDLADPGLAPRIIFAAVGGGTPEELDEVAAQGIVVFPEAEAAAAFAAADATLDPSLSPEFGLGIARALARGLPVVARDLPANRRLPVSRVADEDGFVEALSIAVQGIARPPAPVLLPAVPLDLAARIEAIPRR